MRLTIGLLAGKVAVIGSKSRTRIFRKATGKWEPIAEVNAVKTNDAIEKSPDAESDNTSRQKSEAKCDYRENEMKIQMLSAPLYEQVFRNTVPRTCESDAINR